MKRKAGARRPRLWDIGPVRLGSYTGWRLRRKALSNYLNSNPGPMVHVATVLGWRADALVPLIVDAIEREGYKGAELAKRQRPYPISEEEGYRLALALSLIKRTDSVRRAQSIVHAARSLEPEEAYLWYSYFLRAERTNNLGKMAQALAFMGDAVW